MDSLDLSYLPVALLPLIPATIGLLLFLFVLLNFKQDHQIKIFLAFLSTSIIWQVSDAMVYLSDNQAQADRMFKLSAIVIHVCTVLSFHFACVLVENKRLLNHKLFNPLLYGPAVFFICLQIAGVMHWESSPHPTLNWIFEIKYSFVEYAEMLWIGVVSIASLLLYWNHYRKLRKSDWIGRVRVLIIASGLGIPILFGVIFQILLPVLFNTPNISITAPAMVFFSLAVIIALFKYKLFHFDPLYATREVLEMMNEGVVIINEHFRIKYANKAFLEFAGLKSKDVIGASLLDFEHVENEGEMIDEPDNIWEFQNREYTMKSEGKDPRQVQLSYSNYVDQHGNEVGAIVVFTDVSEQKKMNEKLINEKKQAQHLQSMLIGSQLNPHFIFNTLNSIQFYILDQEVESALDYVSDFSKLMRVVLNNSLKPAISLEEEKSFLIQYMDLELKRFEDKFSYEINIDGSLDEHDILIPPMLIQPYVENSIIHGFGGMESGGKLTINFKCTDEHHVLCEVIDNGCGRQAIINGKIMASENNHKSHGLRLMKTRMSILNEINEADHYIEIEDVVSENGKPLGTKVNINFPIHKEFNYISA